MVENSKNWREMFSAYYANTKNSKQVRLCKYIERKWEAIMPFFMTDFHFSPDTLLQMLDTMTEKDKEVRDQK